MSKLAHSFQPTMDEIERRALKEPIENDGPWDGEPTNLQPEWVRETARVVDFLCNHNPEKEYG